LQPDGQASFTLSLVILSFFLHLFKGFKNAHEQPFLRFPLNLYPSISSQGDLTEGANVGASVGENVGDDVTQSGLQVAGQ